MRFQLTAVVGVVALALASSAAAASDPTHYLDKSEFHALGVIDQVTNFDAFPEGAASLVTEFYFEGDLYINSQDNIVVGKGMPPYFPVRSSIVNDDVGAISILTLAPGYNMLSLQLGRIVGNGEAVLDLFTTQGLFTSTYAVFPANEGFKFHGFVAPTGDYFTGVTIRGVESTAAISVSEIEIGRLGAVPEPSTWAMMILGFGLAGASLRKRRLLAPLAS
jgi:hypothetical protein